MSENKSKADLIAERQANLPLPDQPPVASDFNTADASSVDVGSGGVESGVSRGAGESSGLRGPASTDSAVRTDGAAFKTGTSGTDVGRGRPGEGLPSDAVARGSKDHSGLKHTENPDYGYPEKSDPSSGLK